MVPPSQRASWPTAARLLRARYTLPEITVFFTLPDQLTMIDPVAQEHIGIEIPCQCVALASSQEALHNDAILDIGDHVLEGPIARLNDGVGHTHNRREVEEWRAGLS